MKVLFRAIKFLICLGRKCTKQSETGQYTQKSINRLHALGGGWGGGGPNPPPLKCRTPMHNLHHSKPRFAQSDSTLANKFVLKNQLKKMQPRGKTCFLQHTQVLLKQKSEKVHQKKPSAKIDALKKSVEKMQARGKTCFLHHTENTTHSKVRQGSSKVQLPMKHPKHNHHPKMQTCTT